MLGCDTGQSLRPEWDRTPRRNKRLHLIQYRSTLKFNRCNLQNGVLFRIKTCSFQVKCYTNGGLYCHVHSLVSLWIVTIALWVIRANLLEAFGLIVRHEHDG